jgi:hypothetical protein
MDQQVASRRDAPAVPSFRAILASDSRRHLCAVLLAVWPLALLGELLVTRTHHRPLGAVAFACAAFGTFVACEFLAARWLSSRFARAFFRSAS